MERVEGEDVVHRPNLFFAEEEGTWASIDKYLSERERD